MSGEHGVLSVVGFVAVVGKSLAWGYVDHLGSLGGSFAALAGSERQSALLSLPLPWWTRWPPPQGFDGWCS